MKMMISNPRSGLRLAFDAAAIAHIIKQMKIGGSEDACVALVGVKKLTDVTKLTVRFTCREDKLPLTRVNSSPRSPEYSWAATWHPNKTPNLNLPLFGAVELNDSNFEFDKLDLTLHLPPDDKLPVPVARARGVDEPFKIKEGLVEVNIANPDGSLHRFKVPMMEALSLAMRWGAEGKSIKE